LQALAFWKTVTKDSSNFLEELTGLLHQHHIRYCVIGGQGVNAYAEPLVSLDLDLVVAVDQLPDAERLLRERFRIERFPHSINVSAPGSELRVQIQTDARYFDFPGRAAVRDVLGLSLPVAAIEDVLAGKVWAVQDSDHGASKRRKDLLDIERLLDTHPALRSRVPAEVLKWLSAPL
jgi:hypothetical protein